MKYPDTIEINFKERNLEVDYTYSHDPGIHTFPNGDPGTPSTTEFEIIAVRDEEGKDFMPILNRYESIWPITNPSEPFAFRTGIITELENEVLEAADIILF